MPTLEVDDSAPSTVRRAQSFLDLHYANLRVLKIEQDFYDLARAYLTRAAAAGVRRARSSSTRRRTWPTGCRWRRCSAG